jgi:hypothetical protein
VPDGETGVCKQVELPVQVFEAKREDTGKRANGIMLNTSLKFGWWRRGRVNLYLKRGLHGFKIAINLPTRLLVSIILTSRKVIALR